MTEKLLIVDDEEDIRLLLGKRLRHKGFEVILAENGKEGLSKAISESPDLVVLDVMMPGMDGVQMSLQMRELPELLRCPSPATGIDISMGGIRFACEGLQVSEGETLPLELRLDGQSFLVVGTVVRVASFSRLHQEVALVFKELDSECQRRLAELLGRS